MSKIKSCFKDASDFCDIKEIKSSPIAKILMLSGKDTRTKFIGPPFVSEILSHPHKMLQITLRGGEAGGLRKHLRDPTGRP